MVAIKSLLMGTFASVALAGEGIHLLNCGYKASYSVVLYCHDDSNCNFNPAPTDYCTKQTDGFFNWETQSSCDFTSGVTFNWSISGDAINAPWYTPVGEGWNNYRSFKIYKDNARTMYYDSFDQPCKSYYYAI